MDGLSVRELNRDGYNMVFELPRLQNTFQCPYNQVGRGATDCDAESEGVASMVHEHT